MSKRRSWKEWASLIERWKRSGLTAKQFAERAGVSWRTLSWWKWRLGSGTASRGVPSAGMEMVPVQVVASQPEAPEAAETAVELVVDGIVVRVRRGFDDDTLARVLDVLEQGVEGE